MSEAYQIPKLGRLRTVDLREVWASEPYAFTPWLAQPENLQFLAETIGLPALELVTTEHAVDVFSADIVAKTPDTGQTVLIENQIERTDHTHLGQVLTYAAGLDAAIIVWIARRFTEGHRAALDWLNRITSDDFAFFGVEIEAVRIGDSEPAPRFTVIARPNAWSRQLKAASAQSEASPQAISHAAFWAGYEEAARRVSAPLRVASKPVTSTNYYVPIGKRGSTYLCAYRSLSTKKEGVYVSIQGAEAASVYEALWLQKDVIEAAYGEPLGWKVEREGSLYGITAGTSAATVDEALWPDQQRWLTERMKQIYEIVSPIVLEAQAASGPRMSNS